MERIDATAERHLAGLPWHVVARFAARRTRARWGENSIGEARTSLATAGLMSAGRASPHLAADMVTPLAAGQGKRCDVAALVSPANLPRVLSHSTAGPTGKSRESRAPFGSPETTGATAHRPGTGSFYSPSRGEKRACPLAAPPALSGTQPPQGGSSRPRGLDLRPIIWKKAEVLCCARFRPLRRS